MISRPPRSCARWLSRGDRLVRLRLGSSDRNRFGAAASSPSPSPASFSLPRSPHRFHCPAAGNHRRLSFKSFPTRIDPSKERAVQRGGEGGSDNRGGRGRTNQTNRHHANRNEQQPNRSPRRHSVRLIGESAARRTTDLFLKAHEHSSARSNRPDDDVAWKDDGVAPWEDAATLLAAEQTLEFWAHRNNNINNKNNRGQSHKRHHNQSGGSKQQFAQNNSLTPHEEDAETALRLFSALHHFHTGRNGNGSPRGVLSNGMYSHAIDALAKSPCLDHVSTADALLRQFISLYVVRHAANEKEGSRLTAVWQESEDALRRNEEVPSSKRSSVAPSTRLAIPADIRWNAGDSHHFPNQIRITGVMRGYARRSRPWNAESLLDLMISLASSGADRRVFRANEVGFATVIDAYSRLGDGPNAQRVLQMMKRRSFRTSAALDEEALREETGMPLINAANVVAYNAAVSAWARRAKNPSAGDDGAGSESAISTSRAAADEAKNLLREMWSEHEAWNQRRSKDRRNMVLPDVVTYSAVISAYASCLDQPYGAERARELLVELEGLAVRESNEPHSLTFGGGGGGRGGRNTHGFAPNATVYNALLQAYANAGDATAAEALLRSMTSLHAASLEEGGGGPFRCVSPNTRTFNVVLNAWAKGGGAEGGRRASEILKRMDGMDGPTRPDVVSYNTVLAAWSKSAAVAPLTPTEGADVEEGSNIVGKSAAYRALELLDAMERRHARPRSGGGNDPRRLVRPDAVSYGTAIAAFANAARTCEDGAPMAEEAEALLSRMKERSGIEPDAYCLNGVLLAWARSSGGLATARRAESILRSMAHPDAASWSAVANAYARADGAAEASALLGEMERDGSIAPSIAVCNAVLHAWGRSTDGDASRNAEGLLGRMEDAASGLPGPDAVSYRLVLTAMQHGRDRDKAARARSVLDRLLAAARGRSFRAGRSDVREAYNCVLTSCAYTPADAGGERRTAAMRILVETFRDMNQLPSLDGDGGGNGPDQESYALFLQGCIHLFGPGSEERDTLLKSAFRECCGKGLLNRVIWEKFCCAVGTESAGTFVAGLVPGDEVAGLHYENLPAEWMES